jgi:hypothetical protein
MSRRMRFCPDCPDGIAYGRAKRCAACRAARHRTAARQWYARNRGAELAKDRARVSTPAQRARHALLKRAYERAATQADVDSLLAAWGERPRQMRRSRSVA